ncbi:hypothetical protein EJ110_NYTH33111 [Nymphaea thermarum]|nr:hypothetical protein EJ110_NYTH33111 [Nymphaea thermarum]
MTRVAGLVFLSLLLFCILGSEVVAAMGEGDVMNVQHSQKSALMSARGDAPRHSITRPACSSAKSAAASACVSHLATMATSRPVLAITTGRPRGVAPNALEQITVGLIFLFSCYVSSCCVSYL